MSETDKTKILLVEYQEAGSLCRQFENHCRISLTILVALSAAIVVAITRNPPSLDKHYLPLALFGLLGAVVTSVMIKRSQRYYKNYLDRAKEIEGILKMTLYSNGYKNQYSCLTNKELLWLISVIIGFLWFGYIAVLLFVPSST